MSPSFQLNTIPLCNFGSLNLNLPVLSLSHPIKGRKGVEARLDISPFTASLQAGVVKKKEGAETFKGLRTGVVNMFREDIKGVEVGAVNLSERVTGFSAGILCSALELVGAQVSVFGNFKRFFKGAMLAVASNTNIHDTSKIKTERSYGLIASCLVNKILGDFTGVVLSPSGMTFWQEVRGDFKGLMLAFGGLMQTTGSLHGVMIGGLMHLVNKGIRPSFIHFDFKNKEKSQKMPSEGAMV